MREIDYDDAIVLGDEGPIQEETAQETALDVVRKHLVAGESVLWCGQPVFRLLSLPADLFLVPFSLLWGGFAIFWETAALGMLWFHAKGSGFGGTALIFPLFGIPFVLLGLYMIAGRFVVKWFRTRKTWYAVTNKRLLVVTRMFGENLQATYLDAVPCVSKTMRKDGIGTIRFGNPAPGAAMFENTGWDFAGTAGRTGPAAFYDIPDAEKACEIVDRLRSQR